MQKKVLVSTLSALTISFSGLALPNQHIDVNNETQMGQHIQADQHTLNNNKNNLRSRLKKLGYFTAKFTQQVINEQGEVLETSTGELALSKPNLANWQVLTPDEMSIISDGTNVWFYNPWIEQVSVYGLSAAIAQTPILLLTSNDDILWEQYFVEVNTTNKTPAPVNDTFIIEAIDNNSQIKKLTLIFNGNTSQLTEFSFLDATGQLSQVKLSDFDSHKEPTRNLFQFEVPENVQIDDQR